jgi:dihydroorotase
MHLFAGDTQFSLCRAMTELLALGVKLEDVVPMVTSHCAAMIGMESELGSLAPGMSADISVLSDETGEWKLADNGNVTVTAKRRVAPLYCFKAGRMFEADAPILPH